MLAQPLRRLMLVMSQIALSAMLGARLLPAQDDSAPHCPATDSHLHLTNYVQRGPELRELLALLGDSVQRVAVFGIPLQQQWSYGVTGSAGPTYYLDSDAPLYYYSFTDAYIAMQVRGLSPAERSRVDPMITGFNPADMYAADHIRRVLRTFPGVFSGIGEFTVHKEFVSDKTRPGPASLLDPALDSVLSAAASIGLIAIVHNDVDVPFPRDTLRPAYLEQMKALVRRHPTATIIWAHMGLGRIIRPIRQHVALFDAILADPAFANLYFDISWDELAKYVVANAATIATAAGIINRHPDRFLFGTDVVGPRDAQQYFRICVLYRPFLAKLTPAAREQLTRGNYDRLFNAARARVRAWEEADRRGTTSTTPTR
jgi:predicted TIM-barrel fold metal-dependent hydrolase